MHRPRAASTLAFLVLMACVAASCSEPEEPEPVAEARLALGGPGAACKTGGDCQAGLPCRDGVCCSSLCNAKCYACAAALKESGKDDGICGPALAGTNPRGGCSDTGLPCYAGTCNGYGYCADPPKTECATPSCAPGDQRLTGQCDTQGKCVLSVDGCAPYACAAGNCLSQCTSDTECAAGHFCRSKQCVPTLADGEPCTLDSQCTNDHCTDVPLTGYGVCCNVACTGLCQTCRGSQKSSGSDGVCGAVKPGADPRADCAPDGTACGLDGTCDGQQACAFQPAWAACDNLTTCSVSLGQAQVSGLLCDGKGQCNKTGGQAACIGYAVCDGSKCATSCDEQSDCASGYVCAGGACVTAKGLGQSCNSDAECSPPYCVDGRCCSAPCTGQCEHCGDDGVCAPVLGAPKGNRPPCPTGTTKNPCLGRLCDGTDRTTCQGFVSGVVCVAASCNAGSKTLEAQCMGSGECPEPVVVSCGGFACDGVDCKDACQTDADCVDDTTCDLASGLCKTGTTCASEVEVRDVTGGLTSCAPYRCIAGGCVNQCESNQSCAPGYLCNRETERCEAPEPSADLTGPSCLCGAGRRPSSLSLWLGVALALLACSRRRGD